MSGEKQGFIWRWKKGREKQNSKGKCMLWQIGRCRRERRTEVPPASQPCKVFHLILAKEREQLRKGLEMTKKNGCEASNGKQEGKPKVILYHHCALIQA